MGLKLLIVTDAWSPQVNGVVFTLSQTCGELSRMGHQVKVIQPGLFRSIPCPTYREIRLSLPRPGEVQRLIHTYQPDALHIATEGPLGIAARRYALRNGLAFTTAYHTRFPEYLQVRTRLPLDISYGWLRRFHGAATRTMVPTASVRDELISRGFDPSKVVIWSRGVDTSVFNPDGPTAAASVARRRPVFLYAGRVAVEKNLDAFLQLDLPGEKWVIGGGPLLNSLKSRYPAVRFFGPMPHAELAQHYRLADVFVFPSLTDTFGLVLLEAMACGCPVAALPAAATVNVLADSGAGVVNQDLRQACLDALTISRDVPAHYARQFSWQATTQTFFQYLQPIKQ